MSIIVPPKIDNTPPLSFSDVVATIVPVLSVIFAFGVKLPLPIPAPIKYSLCASALVVANNRPATIKDRKARGYKAGPILKRTKHLRNSIKVIADMNTKNIDMDSTDYAEYLNDGRSNMEPRIITEMPNDWGVGGIKRQKICFIIWDSIWHYLCIAG